MKVFFDCEFTSLTKDADLISLGLVSEDGRTFYAEFNDYDICVWENNVWLKENVKPKLRFVNDYSSKPTVDERHHAMKGNRYEVATALYEWLFQFAPNDDSPKIEIWSDCLAYDWVLFCDLWGGALSLPRFVYYIPFDLATLLKVGKYDPDLNREEMAGFTLASRKHNALHDALVIQDCYRRFYADTQIDIA